MMQKDTEVINISDTHSSGTTALFLDRFWQGKHTNHTPTSLQERIRNHFDAFGDLMAEKRKGKKVILIHNGDATEGTHHNSAEVCTQLINEQRDIHIEIMNNFMKRIGWRAGDELYYVTGAECHTGDIEDEIAMELGAQQTPEGMYSHSILKLNVNQKWLWYVHEGPTAGKGANEGNALRNFLRDKYWDCVKDGDVPPDLVCCAHVHTRTYNSYIVNNHGRYKTIHGLILPSWQAKTRYAHDKMPIAKNQIGGAYFTVTAEGNIIPPEFFVMST